MTFKTDAGWTPATYRHALAIWKEEAPANDSEVTPRRARSSSPRHAALSGELRSLLRWRELRGGRDWTSAAANDNFPEEESSTPVLAAIDSNMEVRPTIQEMMEAVDAVKFEERRHAKLGGGGTEHIVPVCGEISRGPVHWKRGRNSLPDCIVGLGKIQFSNGGMTERALKVDTAGRLVMGAVRIPLGGIVRCGKRKAAETYVGPKGAANDNFAPTVGVKLTACAPAYDFVDAVAEADEAKHVSAAVGDYHAKILDAAICASCFADVGRLLGHTGKAAERHGKTAVIESCRVLEAVLAA